MIPVMINLAKTVLSHERMTFFAFAVVAALALATALTSQYAYGLQPCVLCQYQRAPYVAVIVLCVLGIAFGQGRPKLAKGLLALTGLTFLANAVIAFYHTGVERHWWRSFMEGCSIPQIQGSITDVLAQISATPVARCDEIPWTDPVLGLSMANYNIAACLVFAVAAAYALTRRA